MKWYFLVPLGLLLSPLLAEEDQGWSWNPMSSPNENLNSQPETQTEDDVIIYDNEDSFSSPTTINQQNDNNNTVEKIVDTILTSARQGRNLPGFDELYNDQSVQKAVENDDEVQAKNVIRERLCGLGLMQCESGEVQEKRPYIAPEDLVYAQPVDIKPIGRPIPSIPIRNPNKLNYYGAPKPVPFPGPPGFNHPGPQGPFNGPPGKYGPPYKPLPPPRREYGPGKPYFTGPPPKPFATHPPTSFEGDFLPTKLDKPYEFDTGALATNQKEFFEKKTQANGVQQHVHHHFHHATGEKDVKVPFIAPVNTNIGTQFAETQAGFIASNYGGGQTKPVFETVEKPLTIGGIGGAYGGQTIASYGGSNPGLGGFTSKPSQEFSGLYGPNTFGTSVGSYGNSGFFKKELNLGFNQLSGNSLQGYQSIETPRNENFDCVCVPYDQCPSSDIIGRKDDLYLAIDPRNIKSDIEALSEERVITDGNGTMTVIRVAKEVNETKPEESTKKTKRETANNQTEAQGRQGQGILKDKRVVPTFGVSFGLPQGGGGYPINPHGPNPLLNPYGGAVGNPGINLGLVSVNPLVSVQLTKDEYGDKVVKPYVNLHVTPNDFLVHKFHDFINFKKGIYPPGPYPPGPYPPGPYPPNHYHQHHHSYVPPPHFPHKPHYHIPHGHGPPHPPLYEHPTHGYEGGYQPEYADGYDYDEDFYGRNKVENGRYQENPDVVQNSYTEQPQYSYQNLDSRAGKSPTSNKSFKFPSRKRRDVNSGRTEKRQAYYPGERPQVCGPRHVCCKRPLRPQIPNPGLGHVKQCGTRHSQGINGRIKNPVYVDGDSEFGEYPWQVAILKKDPKESVYVCGGTLIDQLHILTAAHCVKTYGGFDLRVRLGEWDVNHDVEFYPYIERDIISVEVHPEFYAGTLYNDLAILRMDKPVDWSKQPHISPACLPSPHEDYTGQRCWTTGWGKDAFGEFGKYQNILKEVDVPIVNFAQCQRVLQQTRLGYEFRLHPGFLCAGGEEGKDACKGDGGGPMVCERGGTWQIVGVVSWGIGCGQPGLPGVYVKVSHYLDWIRQVTQRF